MPKVKVQHSLNQQILIRARNLQQTSLRAMTPLATTVLKVEKFGDLVVLTTSAGILNAFPIDFELNYVPTDVNTTHIDSAPQRSRERATTFRGVSIE